MSQREESLKGWNGIVRIGNTIRRPARPSSRTIQALLRHLKAQKFGGVPEGLGFDEQGREILSYLPGSAEHYPWRAFVYSEGNLYRVARLLRQYHDATVSFPELDDATWSVEIPAAPGPRLWDVAFAVYRFARLCELSNIFDVSDAHLDRVAQRIRRFCDYYGFEERIGLLNAVLRRLEYQINLMSFHENLASYQRDMVEEHVAFYRRDALTIARHAEKLERYL